MLSKSVKCALIVLCELDREKKSKRGLMVSDLRERAPSGEIYKVLTLLKDAGWIGHKSHLGDYVLSVDIRTVSLYDVIHLIEGWPEVYNTNNQWPEAKRNYAAAREIDCCMDEMIKSFTEKVAVYDFSAETGFNMSYRDVCTSTI